LEALANGDQKGRLSAHHVLVQSSGLQMLPHIVGMGTLKAPLADIAAYTQLAAKSLVSMRHAVEDRKAAIAASKETIRETAQAIDYLDRLYRWRLH